MRKILLLLFITLAACGTKTTNNGVTITKHGRKTVVGTAKEETKFGPLVVTQSGERYAVDSLSGWPEGVPGKQVKVTGNMVTIDRRVQFKNTPYIQGVAYKRVLKDIKWELAK